MFWITHVYKNTECLKLTYCLMLGFLLILFGMPNPTFCVKLKILKNVEWPEQFPFKPEDFQRFDE